MFKRRGQNHTTWAKIEFPVIEDINHEDTNSHAEKMLQIPADETRHTKLDSEKPLKRTRGKPSAGYVYVFTLPHAHT